VNATIRSLAGFCRDHPVEEKVFVCTSFVVGRQIGEALARESGSWINLRFVTLPSLASEIAAVELSRSGLRLAAGSELLVFVDALFRELKDGGRLEYFKELRPSPGISRALLRAIDRLRMEGLTSGRIDPGLFAVAAKGRDIVTLSAHYESRLEAAGGIDLAGLFTLAADVAGRSSDREKAHVLCPADTALSRVEKAFLEASSGGRLAFVGRDRVHGLERPRHFQAADEARRPSPPAAATDAERLTWLFDPKGAPPPFNDGSVEIFRALGPMNESREVLRRIVGAGVAFDDVEMVCPPGPAYAAALHRLSLRVGLPVTFAEGLPLSLTRPGRVLEGILEWIEEDFLASTLCRLVESHDLRLPSSGAGGDIPPRSASRHLQKALIGWGRGRYVSRLEALRKKTEAEAEGAGYEAGEGRSEEERKVRRLTAAEIGRLADAVGRLLAWIPDLPRKGPVPFAELCLGLSAALEAAAATGSDVQERDAQALRLITTELGALAGGFWDRAARDVPRPPEIGLEAALDRIRTAVFALSVGASAPRPGHLHVSGFSSGGYSGRPLTFVLGLDDSDFPGRGLQDPVLLDAEREALSPGLATTADSLRESVYSMAALLASLRGQVIFSFPAYDILEDRARFPSSLLLQVHRLLCGDDRRDYASLDESVTAAAGRSGRADTAGFLPGGPDRAVDETEWWLDRLAGQGRLSGGLAAVRKHFPGLADGIRAEEARAGERLTAYEGIVRIDRGRFDPLVNGDLELSASRLESLVKCPFGYFLRYVLGIEPPEELEPDHSRWLDAKDRGSLIHEILCAFMTRIAAKGDRPDPSRHGPLIKEKARQAIAEWAESVPPPSPGIFEKECQDIDQALSLFLKVEGARPAGVRPLLFEKSFSRVPVEIEGGRSFLLKGFIDRIDRTGPDTFKVLDYKTGSPRRYQDLTAFGQGRIIQHALYAVAAEKILVAEGLAREARVTESGYFFPTRRGEGGEVMVKEFDRPAFRALLADILALVSKGFFPTSLKDECRTCDFEPVCGGVPGVTKGKIKANPEILEALERLKAYD